MQMLRRQDYKSTREIIKDSAGNNSMVQEVVEKTMGEVSYLREENRYLKGSIDLALGGSSDDSGGKWLQGRGPILKSRNGYTETTTDEEGANDEGWSGKKRVRRDDESDMEESRKRQIRFERATNGSVGRGYYTIKISHRAPRGEIIAERTDSNA